MEEKLLKILTLANLLNQKQDKVYAQITYEADESKRLEIAIRSKKDYTFIEKCEIKLSRNPSVKWDSIIKLLESYVGGANDE